MLQRFGLEATYTARPTTMLLGIGVMLLVSVAIVFGVRLMPGHEPHVGPQLHARIHELFEPHEGVQMTAEGLRALELQADSLFRDIMTGVGLVPTGWCIRARLDEVLGPVPLVHGPGDRVLSVADFEQRLKDGRIDIES